MGAPKLDDIYQPIRLSTIRGDLQITFDAYIKVAGKYILFCRQGDPFPKERLERLHEKNVKHLYILQDHLQKYMDYMNQSLKKAFASGNGRSVEEKAQLIKETFKATIKDFFTEPDNEAFYQVLQASAEPFIEFLFTEHDSIKHILAIPNEQKDIALHGVNVAVTAVGLAHLLGLLKEKSTLIQQMLVGCLIHDMAHYLSKQTMGPLDDLSPEELTTYKNHPRDAANLIKDLPYMDQLVVNIVLQHEEKMDGSGFPQKLTQKDMDPLVMIAATANAYDRLVSFEGLPFKEALKKMLIDRMGEYPLDYLKGLQKLLKTRDVVT